jgi:peptidoglycan/xylan/chitin deacetylase (PgdA/CDA1 family)
MKEKFSVLFRLFVLVLLLPACRTITHSSENLGVPPSVVVFSFDDGPNANGNTTSRVLDTLKEYNIRAMFSLLGENAEAYPHLVRRIYDEGHIIVNHGYYDKAAIRMDDNEFRDNLFKGEKAISGALGKELNPKLYRPHGGFYKTRQEKICLEEGYALAFASARAYDAVLTGTEQGKAVKRIIRKIEKQNGGIILLHDARGSHSSAEKKLKKTPDGAFDRSWFPEALEEIITALLEKGYRLNAPFEVFTQ